MSASASIASKRRMPAEWEPHKQTWMGWPERKDTWPEAAVPARHAFAEVAAAIAAFEPVTICATRTGYASAVAAVGHLYPNVRVAEMSMDDAWFRDTGPIFVEEVEGVADTKSTENVCESAVNDRRILGLCWKFDAWGQRCYSDWSNDELVGTKICALERLPSQALEMVLEGGSIHSDGEGTILTTRECLLEPNEIGRKRNPHLTEDQIDSELKLQLGATTILWVPRGMCGDTDTNGHVDNMCCFLRPGVVALHWEDESVDPEQYARSLEAEQFLLTQKDAMGRSLEVVRVWAPRGLRRTAAELPYESDSAVDRGLEETLPGSYINFYLAGGRGVIVPQFGDVERDSAALVCFKEQFPESTVVPVSTRAILVGGGNIHCITKQQPTV